MKNFLKYLFLMLVVIQTINASIFNSGYRTCTGIKAGVQTKPASLSEKWSVVGTIE